MGRYVTGDEMIDRWPDLSDLGASHVDSWHIAPAETELDGRLGVAFAAPFSSDNATVKELTMWLAYAAAANLKDEKRTTIMAKIDARIERLLDGREAMSVAGTLLSPAAPALASTTQDYTPVFGLSTVEDSEIDPDRLYDEAADREY